MARIAVICFAAMALFGSVVAQSPAPSPTSDCLSYITTLAPCLKFVTTPTNQTKPDKDCCTALSTVVSTKVTCLCLLLNPSNSLGLQINMTQALTLPAACNVKTPSVSQCNTASSPTAMSPAKSPAMSPHLSPATSPPTASPAASPPTSLASSPAPVSNPPSPAPFTGGTALAPAPASGISGAAPPGMVPSSASPPPSPKSPSPSPAAENTVNSAGTIFAPSAVFAFVGFVLATFQLGI